MKKMKNFKTVLSLALVAALGFAPVAVNAAPPNTNQSVDAQTGADTKIYFKSKKSEITIGLGGEYRLIPKTNKTVSDFGFEVLPTSNKIRLLTPTGYEYYNVTWKTQSSYYAPVDTNGNIVAKNLSPKDAFNQYIPTKVYACIPAGAYTNAAGDTIWTENGVVTTFEVTIVPEEDLSVYFLGVWSEDEEDTDAQHVVDYAVKNSNFETQIRAMAQNATKHCNTDKSKIVAYTKTNDGVVRVYFKTFHASAGTHYYCLAFQTDTEGLNKLDVNARDYCETEYTYMGSYLRR